MVWIEYRVPGANATLLVEYDDRLQFWPFRVCGHVRLGSDVVERSWRGATLRDAVDKAANANCLALARGSVDAVATALEHRLRREEG